MNGKLSARLALVFAVFFSLVLSYRVRAEDGKMNVAPNDSFENDLTGINTNTCVFGGWFPIGVVTDDGASEMEIVGDVARTGKKSLRVTPNPGRLTGTIYYSPSSSLQRSAGQSARRGARRYPQRHNQGMARSRPSLAGHAPRAKSGLPAQ